jgi:prepilin-type N-terminal cleavage/methylation domain-containing protein
MKKAFTLVEILIVVTILGILAAIALPTFQDHVTMAKEAAAKDTLRIVREAIERYTNDHNGKPPGYLDGTLLIEGVFPINQLIYCSNLGGRFEGKTPTAEYKYGPYLIDSNIINPFNKKSIWILVSDFPQTPDGANGWLYKPDTKEIRLDWPGTDKDGVRYYDY